MSVQTISDRQFEIIEAAGLILTTSGVSGLTIKNLAKAMEFSESAIYRHFDSKEAIILAMLDYLAHNMDKRLNKVTSSEMEPDQKLEALFASQFSFFSSHPHFVVAVFSEGLLEASQSINEAILRIMQVKMSHLLPTIAQGQKEGVFKSNLTAEQWVHVIMGSFRLQMFKWRLAGFEFDIKKEGKILLKALLILIKN